jgi:hypothetical protein
MSASRFLPTTSASVYPNRFSNTGLQETMLSSTSSATIATGLFLTSSSKYCFWCCAAENSLAFSMAMAACGANRLMSLRSPALNCRLGSACQTLSAPTIRPRISNGTTATA